MAIVHGTDARLSALDAFLSRHRDRAFEWGRFDCALFAADWLVALGRPDPAAQWRGAYAGVDGARRILAELGGLSAIATRALGAPRLCAFQAARGDVALIEWSGGESLGVVDTTGAGVAGASYAGFAAVPLRRARRVWAV